jgi:DNA-binding sugar fermentation-stimulating protein
MHDDSNNGDDCVVTTLGESVTIQYKKKKKRKYRREKEIMSGEKEKVSVDSLINTQIEHRLFIDIYIYLYMNTNKLSCKMFCLMIYSK